MNIVPTHITHPRSKLRAIGIRPQLLPAIRAVALFLCLLLATPGTMHAKPHPKAPAEKMLKIVEVNALSITVSLGTAGDTHETYVINDQTKVTLNGAPVNARDLRAGMQASVEASADNKTALTISAKDPVAHPSRHRVG
jgi:hypothetical protein